MSIDFARLGMYDARMERGDLFTALVGSELKGAITAHGWTADAVAKRTGHSGSAFNRWLNGKANLPLTVLVEVCETIGADPRAIVDRAYDRLLAQEEPAPAEVAPIGVAGRGYGGDVASLDLDDEVILRAAALDYGPGDDIDREAEDQATTP